MILSSSRLVCRHYVLWVDAWTPLRYAYLRICYDLSHVALLVILVIVFCYADIKIRVLSVIHDMA